MKEKQKKEADLENKAMNQGNLKLCKFICLNIGIFQAEYSEYFITQEKNIDSDSNTFRNYFI